MPRQARIDAPGALHHIVIRGIEQREIFDGDIDRRDFLDRLSRLLQELNTPCYAWALMPNHAHMLLRTGDAPIATVMRRLLTGYAIRFNRRHRRYGHVFQNRYKSILCEEDGYLMQLVAYIHLNPLRGGIVPDVAALRDYPYTGYSALMGKVKRPWQDTEYVLGLFGKTVSVARRNLGRHVQKWSEKGRRSELSGGGLVRSAGGWRAIKEAFEAGIPLVGDERILGSSEFVEATLKRSGEEYERRMRIQSSGMDLSGVISAVCGSLEVDEKELVGSTRRPSIAKARALIGYIATRELSVPGSEVARRLNVDRSAVSRAIQRAENDADLVAEARMILKSFGAEAKQR